MGYPFFIGMIVQCPSNMVFDSAHSTAWSMSSNGPCILKPPNGDPVTTQYGPGGYSKSSLVVFLPHVVPVIIMLLRATRTEKDWSVGIIWVFFLAFPMISSARTSQL
jgi:hypothetical protein